MARKIRIGCSGYYYPTWKNDFYPKGTPASRWLEYYSSVFDTVELNGTFYRTPKLADLQKYARVTSEGFTFSVKISRYITHVKKLKDSREEIIRFTGLIREGLGEKFERLLFQLPPSFHYTEENLHTLLENIPPSPAHVIEFRHASWWNGQVIAAIRQAPYTLCNFDYPGLQPPFIQTTDTFYLRLHGVPILFKSAYSEEELRAFYHKLPRKGTVHIYFNNTFYDAAYKNALFLKSLANT